MLTTTSFNHPDPKSRARAALLRLGAHIARRRGRSQRRAHQRIRLTPDEGSEERAARRPTVDLREPLL